MSEEFKMQFDLLQPWSTFVMKTQLPPSILQKMLKITNEIVENREGKGDNPGAGQLINQFYIDLEILEQEEVMNFFMAVCNHYVVQAYCQNDPFNKENTLKEEWNIRMTIMWINSQRDNEYFPYHMHLDCSLSAVLYLKIPEFLPNRKSGRVVAGNVDDDGAIVFLNNASTDKIWGIPNLQIQPQVGDFFIFPSTQRHQVYPFRTSDGRGERRSISFNAEIMSKTIKKQQNGQETI